jgi:hypothetical protein
MTNSSDSQQQSHDNFTNRNTVTCLVLTLLQRLDKTHLCWKESETDVLSLHSITLHILQYISGSSTSIAIDRETKQNYSLMPNMIASDRLNNSGQNTENVFTYTDEDIDDFNNISNSNTNETEKNDCETFSSTAGLWQRKGKCVKITSTGHKLLEVTPWQWRHHHWLNYHLSSDVSKLQWLFDLGYNDAHIHRAELADFFCDEV